MFVVCEDEVVVAGLKLAPLRHRSLAMAGYATQPLVGADSVKILIYQLALLYKR